MNMAILDFLDLFKWIALYKNIEKHPKLKVHYVEFFIDK